MMSSKLKQQLEFSFSSPQRVDWRKLSCDHQHELLDQLSLLLMSFLSEESSTDKSEKEDLLCQAK